MGWSTSDLLSLCGAMVYTLKAFNDSMLDLSVGNIPNREILSFKSEITLNLHVLCITSCNQILSFHKYNYYFVGISLLCMHFYGFTFELLLIFNADQPATPPPGREEDNPVAKGC